MSGGTEYRLERAQHAVPCHRSRQAHVRGDAGTVNGKGTHHAHMDMRDVELALGQTLAQPPWSQRVDGQLERQPEGQSVDGNAINLVDVTSPFTMRARGGRQHHDLVPSPDQAGSQVMNLHLD